MRFQNIRGKEEILTAFRDPPPKKSHLQGSGIIMALKFLAALDGRKL